MNSVAELATRYYEDFTLRGDFTRIPMADDLRFDGPMHSYRGGDRYRSDCAQLSALVQGVEIRHQFIEGDQVHTVFDFDLGLPSGPVATSETLRFVEGVLVAADLIIDSTPLRPPTEAL